MCGYFQVGKYDNCQILLRKYVLICLYLETEIRRRRPQVMPWDQLKVVLLFSMLILQIPKTTSHSSATDLTVHQMDTKIFMRWMILHFIRCTARWLRWGRMGPLASGIRMQGPSSSRLRQWSSRFRDVHSITMGRYSPMLWAMIGVRGTISIIRSKRTTFSCGLVLMSWSPDHRHNLRSK